MMVKTTWTWLAISTLIGASVAFAQSGDVFDISWNTIGGGGATSTGGDYSLSSTIGQPDAGVMTGGDFGLTGGLLFETPRGDCNADGLLDLMDHGDFVPCLEGPDGGSPEPACRCFDFDADDDIDLLDFAEFQMLFMQA